jgi:glycosyltransferase involved in cell wall biosynthesis
MSRRLIAHMVTRNEAGRYLDCVLAALQPHVDDIHVYDDLSTDDTPLLAASHGAWVTRRPPIVPSFLVHEGAFRQAAWQAMEHAVLPCPGDWVLCIDADEVLVAPDGLVPAIDAAGGCASVVLPIPEVYSLGDGGQVLIRTDGFWAGLEAPRLLAYQGGGLFRSAPLACGATPTYPYDHVQSRLNQGAQLLHLGYLDPLDRIDKHNRYAGRTGHSAAHVGSILGRPTLVAWSGPAVDVWRGRR